MKYRDPQTGEFKEITVKVADTLPVGTIVEYDGDNIPNGWELVDGSGTYKKIKKTGTITATNGTIIDSLAGSSTTDAPSVNAVNKEFKKSILDAYRNDYTTTSTDYEKVNFSSVINQKGNAFSISNGNIVCNKNMLISIEGTYYWTGISSKRVGYRININNTSKATFNKFCDAGGYYDVPIDRATYQVNQGDVISLLVRTEEGAGGSSGSRGHFILQEL